MENENIKPIKYRNLTESQLKVVLAVICTAYAEKLKNEVQGEFTNAKDLAESITKEDILRVASEMKALIDENYNCVE